MFRALLKRPRDAFDSSPASSTPPQRSMKRFHIGSDASSDAFAFHLPSDSPSNPFGRFKPFIPRDLPLPTPVPEHLVLRFQLGQQAHSVFRIVAVPANYTFWHLHRVAQFLFGWKDFRKEKNPRNKSLRIERRTEHVFTVQKRIVFFAAAKHAGLFKNGQSIVHVAGNIKDLRRLSNHDVPWEREECYTLEQLWHRSGNSSDTTRAVIYVREYDVLSPRKEVVYISIASESEKIKSQYEMDDLSNEPHVHLGSGLPDDDDDDEDFALDLQQFNELHAFENFLLSLEDGEEDKEDDCPSVVRLAEEQAMVKRRMSAPLPKRLPLDEDKDEAEEEPEVPKKLQLRTSKAALTAVEKLEKQCETRKPAVHLPDPEESLEVGVDRPTTRELSPVKKRSHAAMTVVSDTEETFELSADKNIPQPLAAPRKRVILAERLPDPDESREIGLDSPKAPRKRPSLPPFVPKLEESPETLSDTKDVVRPAARKRMPLNPRLPDPEESVEVGVNPHPVPRKCIPCDPRLSHAEDSYGVGPVYLKEAHKRFVQGPHLPDPDESREIGDDRPSLQDKITTRIASRKSTGPFHPSKRTSLRIMERTVELKAEAEEVDELVESEVEV